ncbi:MAG: N-sulfoglucosamine sulfohydrolase [Chthoniobacter sp.]|jgi:arylsulfatase A-like enzyme|nr:N-sulfoglucosamine sulfohydrolase [Chthoniobacter sp.]
MFIGSVAIDAALPASATAAERPNILFAIADDWGKHAGAYGTPWVKTPAFDRVAREGLLFNNAYTPNAKCAPSRACILTGRNSWQLKEAANHLCYFPPEFKGWAEALAEHGWFVGHTQKGWGPGVANDTQGQPRLMTGRAFNARKAAPPTSGISNNDYAGNFEEFLAAAPADQPWAFWYGCVEPHRGYEFGSGLAKGGKQLTDIDRVPGYWPDNETTRTDLLDYAFEVEHFDRHLGRMLETLEKRGLLANTLVIVTSDHGMPFPRVKGNAYEFANHVPLAARWPAGIAKPGRAVDDFVSFIDLAPTFIELAGLSWAQSGLAESSGHSLTDIFRSEKSGLVNPARDHVLIGKERTDIGRPHDAGYPIRAIVKGGWLYLQNFEPARWPAGNPETGYLDCDGGATKSFILDAHRANHADPHWALCFGLRPGEELYDLSKDPDCLHNLALGPQTSSEQSALREQMLGELRQQGDPRMSGQGEVFDRYEHSNKAHVGFYERFMAGEKLPTNWVNPTDYEKPTR